MQPCEKPSDFRAEQCAAFDDVPYSGQLLKWYPHYDPSRPCSLICRGEQSLENSENRLRQETSVEKTLPHDATEALQLDSEETIVVQLADKVEDGTKCYTEGMDVCIGGECMVSKIISFFYYYSNSFNFTLSTCKFLNSSFTRYRNIRLHHVNSIIENAEKCFRLLRIQFDKWLLLAFDLNEVGNSRTGNVHLTGENNFCAVSVSLLARHILCFARKFTSLPC